ncbi:MAG TPA: nitroreductase family protein [Ignavibacteria bacterium]|nr:nitroreductase family protein [Ignavibacteria bacterium]HMR40921.1 nitroreductase family protein [Ignavibacteria bacterium]
MDLFEAIKNRRTTNTAFAEKKVSYEHKELLVKMASHSPSHFNSQPWRFILTEDQKIINGIAKIAGDSMVTLMDDGRFWKQYRKYFRFSEEEMEKTKDGIHIDHLPVFLKPFAKSIFSEAGGKVISKFKVSRILGNDEEKLVATSPLLFTILLTKEEYKKEELSGFYSVISMGAVVQTLWLCTTAIGMGMQFISTPGEITENWNKIADILKVPEDYEMMAIFRMGYVDPDMKRPSIDWKSSQRKSVSELAFKDNYGNKFGSK